MNQFSTNFLGTLHIIQLSLPYFRENEIPGRYLIFSSTSGALGVPGLAPYCATKYAVEGLIESMLYETDCFGIKASLVEPGYLRQDDTEALIGLDPTAIGHELTRSGDTTNNDIVPNAVTGEAASITINANDRPAPDPLKRYGHFYIKPALQNSAYSAPNSPASHAKRVFQWLDKRQPTSAVRSAELVWQLGHCSYPPLRLLLGSLAVESIRDRLRSVIEEIEDWKFLSFPTGEGEDGGEEERDGEGGRDEDGYGDGDGEGEVDGDDGEGDMMDED